MHADSQQVIRRIKSDKEVSGQRAVGQVVGAKLLFGQDRPGTLEAIAPWIARQIFEAHLERAWRCDTLPWFPRHEREARPQRLMPPRDHRQCRCHRTRVHRPSKPESEHVVVGHAVAEYLVKNPESLLAQGQRGIAG
jgi:hypothetical protein